MLAYWYGFNYKSNIDINSFYISIDVIDYVEQ